jgi:N-acetylglucosaminyl-diphospho-decaprenol L-rhamnosyltransferase
VTLPPATLVVVLYHNATLDLSWVPDDAPVVLVHNDDTATDVRPARPTVTHVHPSHNVGFGAGVNAALERVNTPRVVICNPDLEARPEHWTALQTPDLNTIVTVPVVDKKGVGSPVAIAYPSPLPHLLTGWRVGRLFPRGSRIRSAVSGAVPLTRAERVPPAHAAGRWSILQRWVSGAVFSIGTEPLRAVGGFDENYFMYFEDIDLSRRLAESFPAMSIVVADVEPVVHAVGGSSRDRATSRVVRRAHLESAIRYARLQRGAAWRACAVALRPRRIVVGRNAS